jgi:hypothetical protein
VVAFLKVGQDKMVFTTDGRVHHSGISNEKTVCEFLKTRGGAVRNFLCTAEEEITHRGGTGTKADAEIHGGGNASRGISIKHHKSGTFDWLNSSAEVPAALKEPLLTGLLAIKAAFAASAKANADVDVARGRCDVLLGTQLRAMSSELIAGVLNKCYRAYPEYVLITNVAKKEFIAFKTAENMRELATWPGWTYFLKSTPRAKTSAQIWRRGPDGTEVNTHLRLRLVLNNGVNALLGTSAANSNSVPCLKIQQDDVKGFIDGLVGPVRQGY